MNTLKDVIKSIEFCKAHETCDNCPCGNSLNDCTIDEDVLAYLKEYEQKRG